MLIVITCVPTVIFLYFLLYCCLYISTLYIPILNCGQIRQYQAYISVSVFIRPYRIIEFKAQLKFRYQVRPLGFISVIYSYYGRVIRYTYVALPIMHFAALLRTLEIVSWIDKLSK